MHVLIIQSGKHKGKKLQLADGKELVIGRDEDCTLRLATADVSRRHCRIRPTAEGVFVSDLGSQNGTFIDDVRIQDETRLEPGGVLRVGPMILQLAGKKAKAAVATEPSPKGEPGDQASDDEIVSWLADGEGGDAAAGDTSIISRAKAESDAAAVKAAAAEPDLTQPKRRFRSVAEEGADIIRRHQEMLRAEEEQDQQSGQ